ncbi:MAG: hypothetical protein IPG53_21640 [Ignavibacteriales bacterium]|nr:hypothetical protein [Ignavibacteriales bacterium]
MTGIEEGETDGDIHEMEPLAYPNPFNPSTVISFKLNEPAFTIVTAYNITGTRDFSASGRGIHNFRLTQVLR